MKYFSTRIMLFSLSALLLMNTPLLKAQSFAKGQKDLDIGVGLGSRYYTHSSLYASYSSTPVMSVALDFGITDEISLGGFFGFASTKWQYTGTDYCGNGNNGVFYTYTDSYKWNFFMIGVRGAYHFSKFIDNDKVDLYVGLMLGDNYAKFSYTTNAPCNEHQSFYNSNLYGGFIFTGFAGCRYRFNDHVGAFAELGYGVSYLTLGLNYKF